MDAFTAGLLQRIRATESDLVRAQGATEQERTEFAAFFRKDWPDLLRHMAVLGWDEAAAKEAAQEAMTRLFEGWSTVDHPKSWVRTTAQRAAKKAASRDAQRLTRSREAARLDAQEPSRALDSVTESQEVLRLLRTLPPQQRAVMAWTYDGFSSDEISHLLAIPRATVDSHRRHARNRLKEILRRRFEGAEGGEHQ
uniref:RNA polymerase sigma factor n=2 Tax=Streptomyces chartreusis TaxID=1969 RepID=UPI003F49712D